MIPQHQDFDAIQTRRYPDWSLHGTVLRHRATGAQVVLLLDGDTELSFSLVFRTPRDPRCDVAHVLEHMVTRGSTQYPVKDLFREVDKRSLNTELRAVTHPSFTRYGASSRHPRDLRNLMDVFVAAAFHPVLSREVFLTEAWRYELPDAAGTPVCTGITYNEAKGRCMTPSDVLDRLLEQAFVKDGGADAASSRGPARVAAVTLDQVREYHRAHYCPANALMVFHGAHEPAECLAFAAATFNALSADPGLPVPPLACHLRRIREPLQVRGTCLPDPECAGPHATLSWRFPRPRSNAMACTIKTLGRLLDRCLDEPLRQACGHSGLFQDASTGLLWRPCLRYDVTFEGIAEGNLAAAEGIVFDALRWAARDGFDPELLRRTPLAGTERQPDGSRAFNREAALYAVANAWAAGDAILSSLDVARASARAARRIAANPRLFSELVERLLLANPAWVTAIACPDPACEVPHQREERERLESVAAALTPAERDRIHADTAAVAAFHNASNSPERLARLPRMHPADLTAPARPEPLIETMTAGGLRVVHTNAPPPCIASAMLHFDVSDLPMDDLDWLFIYTKVVFRLPKEQPSPAATEGMARRITSVLPPVLSAGARHRNGLFAGSDLGASVVIASDRDAIPETFRMVRELLVERDFGVVPDIRRVLLDLKAGVGAYTIDHSRIGWQPTRSAPTLILERLCCGGNARTSGSPNRILNLLEDDPDQVVANLNRVHRTMFRRDNLVLGVDGWCEDAAGLIEAAHDLAAVLPVRTEAPSRPFLTDIQPAPCPRRTILAPVASNKTHLTLFLKDAGWRDNGAADVAAQILRVGPLWQDVRTRRGAYGVGCHYVASAGELAFRSCNDPHVVRTLQTFRDMGRWLRSAAIGADELEMAIVRAAMEVTDEAPDRNREAAFFSHLTCTLRGSDEQHARRRDAILGTTLEDLRALGEAMEQASASAESVVVVSPEALRQACAEGYDPGLLVPYLQAP